MSGRNSNSNVVARGFDVVKNTWRRLGVKQGGILSLPSYIDPVTGLLTQLPFNRDVVVDTGVIATGAGTTQYNPNARGAMFTLVIPATVNLYTFNADLQMSLDGGAHWSTTYFNTLAVNATGVAVVQRAVVWPGASGIGGGASQAAMVPYMWRFTYTITHRTIELPVIYASYVL